MKDILITSSALILVLLLLRQVFRNVISRRLQYALWALVLVRLLLPTGFLVPPASDYSVLTVTAPVQQAVEERFGAQPYYFAPVRQLTPEELKKHHLTVSDVPTAEDKYALILSENVVDAPALPNRYAVRDPDTDAVTLYANMMVGLTPVLTLIWKLGMVLFGAWFLASNLLFWRKLKANRTPYETGSARKVYLVPQGVIPSPCLFFNAIYLTPAAIASPDALHHVLTHEETHARHGDPIWSLLRCLCLTVYWFDPLVWAAAVCSKTDCELACDESVLEALGEGERIPYGETLLSLIPVKRSDPFLSATTMTAGKKQLRDRITRIARRPRQVLSAVAAVAVLAALAAACTFTGGKEQDLPPASASDPAPITSAAPAALTEVPLSARELKWFNEQFFNSAATGEVGDPYYVGPGGDLWYNFRNQLASPTILYESPEDIDLSELFYLERTSDLTEDECRQVFGLSPNELPCPTYKLSAVEMNAILFAYTGLTLDQANKDSLTYTYLPEYDAYYWAHGDTNYPGDLCFTCGTVEDGGFYRLYENSRGTGQWHCVTLKIQEDGSFRFLSNVKCDRPAIPPLLPAGDPEATLSLAGLEPYSAPATELENRPADGFSVSWPNNLANWSLEGHHVLASIMADGTVRAAVEREDGSMDVFLTLPSSDHFGTLSFYKDLFGHSGFYVDYTDGEGYPQRDYYCFGTSGSPELLLRVRSFFQGTPFQLDLDGDGADELLSDMGDFFFQRDGQIFHADAQSLLLEARPELRYCDYIDWDIYSRACTLVGYSYDDDKGMYQWTRYLYFDGRDLLMYPGEKATVDHMVPGIDHGVPAQAVSSAREYVESLLTPQPDGTWTNGEHGMTPEGPGPDELVFDDWRIESFHGPYNFYIDGVHIAAWGFNYELHAKTPALVGQAGGRYVTEDGWVSPGYPCSDYIFLRQENGNYTFLWKDFYQEYMHSEYVQQAVAAKAAQLGIAP